MFTVCAFYTQDTEYENLAEEFKKNCEEFDLDTYIKPYPSRGSWVKNCGIKPEFIMDCLKNITTDIVYIDVDGRIRQYPELFNRINADIAAHIYRGTELLSGTLYIHNDMTAQRVVHDWMVRQKARPFDLDQVTLQYVVNDWGDSLKFLDLPPEYTKIFDRPMGKAVIEHMQASRENRSKI